MLRLLVFVGLLLVPGSCLGSSLRIWFDLGSYDDDACVTPGIPLRSYLVAVLGGDAAAGGMQGAEFRIFGYDSGWFNAVTPNPSADFLTGHPLGDGCQIAFPICQVQQGAVPILLYTIDTVVMEAIPDVVLRIDRHTAPSNPNFQCPRLVLCDPPVYTSVCVGTAPAYLTACPLSVNATTWTRVRALYR